MTSYVTQIYCSFTYRYPVALSTIRALVWLQWNCIFVSFELGRIYECEIMDGEVQQQSAYLRSGVRSSFQLGELAIS